MNQRDATDPQLQWREPGLSQRPVHRGFPSPLFAPHDVTEDVADVDFAAVNINKTHVIHMVDGYYYAYRSIPVDIGNLANMLA